MPLSARLRRYGAATSSEALLIFEWQQDACGEVLTGSSTGADSGPLRDTVVVGGVYRAMRKVFLIGAVTLAAVGAQGAKGMPAAGQAPTCKVLVYLDRSDEFSFDEHLTVCENGATLARFRYRPGQLDHLCRSIPVSRLTLRRVRVVLAAAQFTTLKSQYLPASEPTEVTGYRVTHHRRHVATDAVALARGLVPARLARVVRTLNGILDARLETPENRTRRSKQPLPAPRTC